jgi:hypothetical protein
LTDDFEAFLRLVGVFFFMGFLACSEVDSGTKRFRRSLVVTCISDSGG